ncbi:hypothetical protein [Finegoldia magna]|uniref:mediterrocin family bacteriocin n=1 Tax=Finegoldia magna TaxID=1260 RepID=UPI000B91C957|nr:hypothetical protein [Finegoldia magna]OXZ38309.1 hypothetical protein B9N50_05460 [Finegoldia magna]HEO4727663.1 hypothetical protein [Streptococcus agalactiae]
MKKLFSTLMASCLIAVFCATPAFARTRTFNSTGKSFDKSWELTSGDGNYLIKYGFNTAFINEDYTHTYHSNRHHVATVTNSNGSFSDEDNGGRWAGIEVRHSGNYVTYSISY